MQTKLHSDNLLMPCQQIFWGVLGNMRVGTVIASAAYPNYKDEEEFYYLVLMPEAPYYRVVHQYVLDGLLREDVKTFPNIIPATELYRELSGCY